ncbi:MAG: hypothetical protein KDA89_07915, partial [Planctomycetaceae bacterium]|nr:hypothetical protein [Planctomycetaceae bacterium]
MTHWLRSLTSPISTEPSGLRPRRRRRIYSPSAAESLEVRNYLSAIVVNTSTDVADPNDGVLSLREAISLANETPNADTIEFSLANRTITVGAELPEIVNPVTIDASAQAGGNPITLRPASSTIDAHGLVIASSGVVINGLKIDGFAGDGIHSMTDQELVLNQVVIVNNDGVGVNHEGSLYLNRAFDVPDSDGLSEFNNNGLGGVFVRQSLQADRAVTAVGNQGVGIAAVLDITIDGGVISIDNQGAGVQSVRGEVTLRQGISADAVPIIVTNNAGPGILAGSTVRADATAAGFDPDDGPTRDVRIQTAAFVSSNGGWGILAARGNVFLNTVLGANTTAVSEFRSTVSGNGASGLGPLTFLDSDGLPDENPNPLYEDRGGIWAAGSVHVVRADVSNNSGAGILANKDVFATDPVVEDNHGTGIQAVAGHVDIIVPGSNSRISRNAGIGIAAGVDGASLFDLEPENHDRNENFGRVTIRSPIEIAENAGWGILAHEDILLGPFEDDAEESVVAFNGNTSLPIFSYALGQSTAEQAPRLLESGGGIAAGGNISGPTGFGASGLFVLDNEGAGVVAGGSIDLVQPNVFGNQGPGIQSLGGSVNVFGSGNSSGVVPGVLANRGAGIQAAQNVFLQIPELEISFNSFWGIVAGGDVFGQEFGGTANLRVSENFNPSTGNPFTIDPDGEMRLLTSGELTPSGGIFAGQNVSLFDVEITRNFGDGVVAGNDIFIQRGEISENTGEVATAGGTVTLIDVTNGSPVVTNTSDSGFGSLRNAVLAGGIVSFDLDVLGPGPHTINLLSELAIDKSVYIDGPGADLIAIDGGSSTRLFSITESDADIQVEIRGLTLRNGNANGGDGGAIFNDGAELTLREVVLTGNGGNLGGAIYSAAGSASDDGGDPYGGDPYGGGGGGGGGLVSRL